MCVLDVVSVACVCRGMDICNKIVSSRPTRVSRPDSSITLSIRRVNQRSFSEVQGARRVNNGALRWRGLIARIDPCTAGSGWEAREQPESSSIRLSCAQPPAGPRCPEPHHRPEPLPASSKRPLATGRCRLAIRAGLSLLCQGRSRPWVLEAQGTQGKGAKGKSRKRGLRLAEICSLADVR